LPFIDNDALASEAVSKFHLDQAPFWLTPQRFRQGGYLDVLNPKSTRLLEIQVEFPDARLASDIANYLAQRAAEFNARLNASDTVAAQKVLKQQLDGAASQLAEIESKRLKLREKARIESKEQQLSIFLDLKKQLSTRIEDLRLSLAQSESRAKFLEGAQSSQAARDQFVSSAADAQAQRAGLQAATAALTQANSEIDRLLADVTGARSEIEKVDRDYALAREAYEGASRDYRNASLAVSAKSVDLKLLAPALVPENPVRPRILLNTTLSALLGLILLGGAAVARESFRELQPEAIHYISEEESANVHRS
jgi:tyrosine-protein kinase Etk/Wzc